MSENECNWHTPKHADNEDKTLYCTTCLKILAEEKFWYGTVTIGDMTSRFESERVGIDLGDTIAEALKAPSASVKITKIVVVERDNGWGENLSVWFNLSSGVILNAIVDYTRSVRYLPTKETFVVPVEN